MVGVSHRLKREVFLRDTGRIEDFFLDRLDIICVFLFLYMDFYLQAEVNLLHALSVRLLPGVYLINATLSAHLFKEDFLDSSLTVSTGATWTTDARIEYTQVRGILTVEMEAAALYAFATTQQMPVVCWVPVTNQMAQKTGDVEKGVANGGHDALHLIKRVPKLWQARSPELVTEDEGPLLLVAAV